MRGRKPKPTAVKIQTGNPGKRKLNSAEPKPGQPKLQPPEWLTYQAKVEWNRLAPLLEKIKVLTEADLDALTSICQLQAQMIEATGHIKKEGSVIQRELFSRNGDSLGSVAVLHPAIKLQMDCQKQLRPLWEGFGLTPSSRSRVRADLSTEEKVNPLQMLKERRAVRKKNTSKA